MINKIIEYIKNNIKTLLFFIVLFLLIFLCSKDFQVLNYILKRGVVLQYEISSDIDLNIDKIKQKLTSFNVKYSYVDVVDNSEFETYDFEQNKIEKYLLIALPVLYREENKILFNNVSDFVFENYKNSKLIGVESLDNNYSDCYAGFIKLIELLFFTFIIWLILMYLIYDIKTINQKIKESVKSYFCKQKENIKKLVLKTKENGFWYFLKMVLFDDNKNEEETNVAYEIISTIFFVVVCVIVIRYFVGELRWIPSGSMRPTILERDRVFVEKINSKKEIRRGDILVFYPPSTKLSNSPIAVFSRLSGIFCKDIAYIKRVIGLPGEKFEIKHDDNSNEYRVYINDKPLNEPYISSKEDWTQCLDSMYCGPFVIPDNNYFMMGDNRNNSQDSRFWGFLNRNRVIGRANFMFWPIKRINILTDKYLDLHKEKIQNDFETYRYILNRYEFL